LDEEELNGDGDEEGEASLASSMLLRLQSKYDRGVVGVKIGVVGVVITGVVDSGIFIVGSVVVVVVVLDLVSVAISEIADDSAETPMSREPDESVRFVIVVVESTTSSNDDDDDDGAPVVFRNVDARIRLVMGRTRGESNCRGGGAVI